MQTQTFGLVAVTICATIFLAAAQTTVTYGAQNVFNQAAQLYSRSDSLQPQAATLYDLSVPSNYTQPDLLLTLNSTSNGTGLGLYCGRRGVQPGPGYALWTSDLSTITNQIYISKNDIYYSQILQRISNTPALTCAIINADQSEVNNYTFAMSVISQNRTLVASEQVLLANIYSRCCAKTGSCNAWKALTNALSSNSNGGMVMTDFCSFPGQICSPSSNLWRLDLSGFNMSCPFPGDIFSQFTQLSTLLLPGNNYSGNSSSLGTTLGALKALQFFDGTGNSAMSGSYASGDAQKGLCAAAQSSLVSLTMTSMNASGSIPDCLYGSGSQLILLDLSQNSFSGSLKDIVPSNTSLEAFDVSQNQLTGNIPASLGNAQKLLTVDFTGNSFSGTIPASIANIKSLASFSVRDNKISGGIPNSFGTHRNLQLFDVKNNSITAFPAAWTNSSFDATNSSWVNIRTSFNNITGGFPNALTKAPQLQYLVINVNSLTGPLPAQNNMFPSLRVLNASSNSLSGSIPSQFNSSALFSQNALVLSSGQPLQQVFDLSYNRFSGNLPDFMKRGQLPTWVTSGINLQGNNLNVSCSDSNFNYITSICKSGASSTSNQQTATPPPPTAVQTAAVPNSPANSATTVSTASDLQQQPRHHNGLSPGAIAGIVIGSVAGAAILAAAVVAAVVIARRRRDGVTMGELGRSISLNKGLTSQGSTKSDAGNNNKFQRFVDEEGQKTIELSPSKELKPQG